MSQTQRSNTLQPAPNDGAQGSPAPARLLELDAGALRVVIDAAVSQVFSIDIVRLSGATRGRKGVALARQVAMYIAHTGLGITLTDVGRDFRRDRTTVAHACAVIEDLRDQPSFDFALQCLESVVRHQLEARGMMGADSLGPAF